MELAAKCLANRPAGATLEEQRAARAEEGRAPGVTPHRGGYKAQVSPKKNMRVTLAAPGGGYLFDTSKAAGKAIEKYEKAGSPTNKSHPLVHNVSRARK